MTRTKTPLMRAAVAAAVAAALLSGAALAPSAEAAPAVQALGHARVLKAGATARFGVELRDTDVSSCRLGLGRGGRTLKRGRAVAITTRERVTWSWKVPRRARSLGWRASATCRMSSGSRVTVSRRVRVRASSRVGASSRRAVILVGGIRVRRHGATLSAPRPLTNPDPTAPTPVPTTTVPTTAPTQGECTDWAMWKRREDLGPLMTQTFAADWDDRARAYGFPVDGTPRVGDIAVWEPGVAGAGPDGHVAYIESVDSYGGTATVSEMNANGDYLLSTRTLFAYHIQAASFIHHK